MGELIGWLMRDEQKDLYGVVFAFALNVVCLLLIALLLWPLDRRAVTFSLAKGYVLFWVIVSVTALALFSVHKIFRVDLYTHADAHLLSNLAVGALMQAGWSAFAALVVHGSAAAAPVWVALILYPVGILSCFVAFNIVSAFYAGQIYRMINLLLAVVSFIVFSVWPTLARLTYGRFFDLF